VALMKFGYKSMEDFSEIARLRKEDQDRFHSVRGRFANFLAEAADKACHYIPMLPQTEAKANAIKL
jgi:hypothetical protein